MKNTILLIILLLSLSFSSTQAQETTKTFILSGNTIDLTYKSVDTNITIDVIKLSEGLEIATISLKKQTAFSPQELSLKWAIPSDNVAGYWSTSSYINKNISPDWAPTTVKSMLSRNAPVISMFGYNDINRQTFAVSEALNTVIASTAVREENGMIYNGVKFFTEQHKALTEYTVQLRIDTRPIAFSVALKDVSDWWASFKLFKPAIVPEAAKLPVYSSWYSYHQQVSKDALVAECKLAKTMGFESIIVDDGWQTLDGNRGYAFTGDWMPKRIPKMKEFVQEVHDLDMKFILWYAVPLVGEKSKAYELMKGKFLYHWEGQGAYVLDPRYPEVRAFIINTYLKAVKEWNLDGFKLDFLGMFRAGKDTKLVADDGRDFASINEATDKLMMDLLESLSVLKPDIMLEFRQPYTGPAMRKYGNMLRAGDCPNLASINRMRTTDLRLLSGSTAVHADMLMWHNSEAVEVAALQLLAVLFSVPQISVQLAEIPKDHFAMVRFYTDYWLKNREVLLGGSFLPSCPQMNYPMITALDKEKQITAVYSDMFVPFTTNNYQYLDVVNAKTSTRVVLDVTGENQNYSYIILNCKGQEITTNKIELDEGAHAFDVPASGLISFTAIK